MATNQLAVIARRAYGLPAEHAGDGVRAASEAGAETSSWAGEQDAGRGEEDSGTRSRRDSVGG